MNESNNNIDKENQTNTTIEEANINSILGINPTLVTAQNEEIELNPNAPQKQTTSSELTEFANVEIDNSIEEQEIKNKANDEYLLKDFIGPNYEKITTRPFNFAGFFLASFYMFYRKMFLYGILLFIIDFIIINIIKINYIILIINIIVGLFINKLYIFFATKKINKIKKSNKDKTLEQQKEICLKKGKTSKPLVFIGIITEMIISIILLLLMEIFGLSANIKDLILNIQNEIKLSGNDTYNGIVYTDSSIKIDEKFNISIPEKFKNYSTKYEYNYSYSSNNKIFNKCMFRLSSPTGYKDANILVEQMHSYYKGFNPTNITQNDFNNINWYNFSFNNNFGKTYYYITSKDNKVYILQYDINIDTDSNCESYKDQIINSIISK